MRFSDYKAVVQKAYHDVMNNHTMAMAAGLSYYFVMSLFPAAILAAAIVAYLPIPDLFGKMITAASGFVPAQAMGVVQQVLKDIITPRRGSFLTVGIVGTLWAASGGFASMIEALNVAYDIPETRPIWKTRLVALGLMFVMGGLLVVAVILLFLGPEFGGWLAGRVGLSGVFAQLWNPIRWLVAISFTVLAVELMFYWAPNVKQRFWATLPGAIIGVGFWIATSWALGLYFQHFANFNKTYGALGGAVAVMVWLYWSWFVVLIGAEINSELLKARHAERLELKEPPPAAIRVQPPWAADTRSDAEKAKDKAA